MEPVLQGAGNPADPLNKLGNRGVTKAFTQNFQAPLTRPKITVQELKHTGFTGPVQTKGRPVFTRLDLPVNVVSDQVVPPH